MSITKSSRISEKAQTKWDEAIADAKKKIKGLEFSIQIFRKRKRAGEPWPGESVLQRNSKPSARSSASIRASNT